MGDLNRLLDVVHTRHCISIVGAGGKTTLLYALADRLAALGRKVVVTTTTHILVPPHRRVVTCATEAINLSECHSPVVYGAPAPGKKLTIPADWNAAHLLSHIDHLLIEADGARQYPCKVPRRGEPVLDAHSDLIIGVVGLSALGKPLSLACFRLEETMQLLGAPAEHRLRPEDLATILTSGAGTKKGVGTTPYLIVLNQCDVDNGWERARRLRHLLRDEQVFCLGRPVADRKEP